MSTNVVQLGKDLGHDVSDLIAISKSAKKTDMSNLPGIENAFKQCELMGKQLIMHEGKLLSQAQDIFYANHPQGKADQLYGKWRKSSLNLSKDQAWNRTCFYNFCHKSGLDQSDPLPDMTTVTLIGSDKTPDAVRRKFTKMLKNGKQVTSKMVKDDIKAKQPKAEDTDDEGDVVSTQVTVDVENIEWDMFFANFTDDQLEEAVAYLATQGFTSGGAK